MIKQIFNKIDLQSNLLDLTTAIELKENCSIFGLNFGEKTLFLESLEKPIIYITSSFDVANKVKKQFESLNKKAFLCFSKRFEISASNFDRNENFVQVINALALLLKNEIDVLILNPAILMQSLPNKQEFKKKCLSFKINENYNFSNISSSLIKMGYSRCDMVAMAGEFSIRGDIVDIFPINSEFPIRLNFFDDQLEEIKAFEVTTYLTNQSFKYFDVYPCSLNCYDNINLHEVIENLKKCWQKDLISLSEESKLRLNSICEDIILKIENNEIANLGNWIFPFLKYNCNILNYVNNNSLIVFDDVKQIYDEVQREYQDFEQSCKILQSGGEILSCHKNFCLPFSKIFETELQKISFQQITTSNRIFNPTIVLSFKNSNLTNYYGKYDLLREELQYYLNYNHTVVIYAKNSSTAVYLEKYLKEHGIYANLCNNENLIKKCEINIVSKYLFNGAIFVEDKLVIIGTTELLGKQEQVQIKSKNKKDVFVLPKENDYVVHEVYGIGLCKGIKRLQLAGYEKDYIIIEYDKGDKLYLPTEQVDLISSYVAGTPSQKLNRLGSQDFTKTKQKVKSSVKEMAFNLMHLYAEREHTKGFKFLPDDMLTKEFENAFQYEETEDQLQAIKDVKKDMESDKIMDRLVCGDVGYGKTEVAMRAIFKAFQSGKQVVFLAPTTILSQQHYTSCVARLSPFMCNVGVLNRFKTPKEQKQTIQDLKDGKIDVLCGTHRVLSKDVVFKNLGLLILDEEQRFGVQDKEKIKNIKSNIDVLSLSATPIPRTLHMSLSGIRDISLITTPPSGRLPIQTCVTEYSTTIIKEAITRELNRGGQVLVVFNNVEKIYEFTSSIRKLFAEEINFGIAHGQMDERVLESAIMDLYNGSTQVLVSTTLIENGIDLPNANTIIIVDADRLGLSQLYQLKGRVGRSRTMGYAYFLYDKQKVLREDAYKRLNAIMEYNELGSGFKIALKDLEIRGCGNIMGKEQHGHMQKVGYDLYCKLLNQAIMEIRGEKIKQSREVKMEIAQNCFIPNNYILDSDNRFRVYNNMTTIKNEQERVQVLKEICDVYGNVPVEVCNLSKVVLLKHLCQNLGVKRVVINNATCCLEFYSNEELIDQKLEVALSKVRKQYFRNMKDKALLTFVFNNENVEEKVNFVINLLTDANNYKNN